ncbi:M23 family metallopeptidase [Salmonella enterica]|uniref:M23 family metallopeptidase n=1 Tax=Salmonella TaxID=590 RepID=UPI001CB87C2A|nr:M23 family metallopeptidase [Salmonella enterica]MCT7115910.1 M23 family metallopeptidase [Salmonella enterica subsp. enterica serovar Montevideo]MCT7179074.1 M23 family metallopeptidase [Salmonella enterica subsp. enterica serovar Montevideo]MCT7210263.1 M23 family metallopeptidase [Salmonella enterica subsp. enterica serovar Montevideo]MCT7245103.1 M23 family metallopeptidase [Salmonella enterica subsp. enterica serovar Montevideo]
MAMDAFPPGTPIYAVADGVLVRAPYPFYSGTSAVEIRHGELRRRSDVTDPAPYLNVWKNNLPRV